jgi:hypothetical protein
LFPDIPKISSFHKNNLNENRRLEMKLTREKINISTARP